MFQAMLLTKDNIDQLIPITNSLMLNDFKDELHYNTEDGIKTYVTIQDFVGMEPGCPLVHIYGDKTFESMFRFVNGEISNVFMDITQK